MNLSIGLSLTRPSGPLGFNPASLFASGEEGAWYDPSDSSTVWQDAAGTTPAGVGDPVGRIDDKSGNGNHATQTTSAARPILQQSGATAVLGSELVTNGTFDTSSDWTLGTGWTITGGEATAATAPGSNLDQSLTTTAGKYYVVEYSITSYTSGNIRFRFTGVANINGVLRSSVGTFSEVVFASSVNNVLRFTDAGGGFTGSIDNISVKEVTSWVGGLRYLDFDGVDDYLSAGDVNGLDGLNAATFGFGAVSTSVTAQRAVTSKWNGPFGFLIDSLSTSQRGFFGSSSVASAAKPGDDAAHVSTWEFDADAYLRVDGLSITLTNPSGPVIPTGSNSEHFLVGAKSDNGVVDRYFLGPIYSLVVIDRRITAGEITDLETYLAAKSGVTL